MSIAQFNQNLHAFLCPPSASNATARIQSVIAQLQGIKKIVQKLPSFRFYASSLLIVYDGSAAECSGVMVRMVDFAQSVTNAETLKNATVPYPPTTDGPDAGYILGLHSLTASFEISLQSIQ